VDRLWRGRFDNMRRREFITLLGGAAAAWPPAARAQQSDRMRRVGVIVGATVADDAEGQARLDAFRQALEGLGWTTGRNLQIEYRSSGADPAVVRKHGAELLALAPDVILSSGTLSLGSWSRRVPCRSYSSMSPIRSAPASRRDS
jgi:putative ABC transport system substrate-binding protein